MKRLKKKSQLKEYAEAYDKNKGKIAIAVILIVLLFGLATVSYWVGYQESESNYERELKEIEKQKFIREFIATDYETAKENYIKTLMAVSLTIPKFFLLLFAFLLVWRLAR